VHLGAGDRASDCRSAPLARYGEVIMVAEAEEQSPFPSAREDKERAAPLQQTPQTLAPSFRLAFADSDFLVREDLRPVRLQLELLKPDLLLKEQGGRSDIAGFGSARIPDRETALKRVNEIEAAARAHPKDAQLSKQ